MTSTPAGAAPLLDTPASPLLILIDGHALVHRAFHAIREPLTVQRSGEDVSAVYGYLNAFLRTIEEWKPSHCIVAFDVSAPTFRHQAFAEYKAHRPPTPPELRGQFGRVRQLMQAFGVPIFEAPGFEADDLLGSLGRQAEERQIETLILTGDSDILQLVSPHVRVLLASSARTATLYDAAKVRERYSGLGPELVAEIKALQGDTSDNIPGVPRVGIKTAVNLLAAYGSIEGIYAHLDAVKPPRIQQSLRENEALALQCKMLTTIRRDAPATLDLDAARFGGFDRADVVALLRELEFVSMVNRIPAPAAGAAAQMSLMDAAPPADDTDYTIVDTESALDDMLAALNASDIVAFDTETTSQAAMTAELVGLSFSNAAGKAWYVPVGHQDGRQLERGYVLERLRPLLENGKAALAAHNANYDLSVLGNYGVKVGALTFDTMLAAHFSGIKAIGLKQLAQTQLSEDMTPISELIGTGRKQLTMDKVDIAAAAPYAAADADMTRRLVDVFADRLEQNRTREPFDAVEMPLVSVLVRMQRNGVAVDVDALNRMSVELGAQLADIQAGMYEVVGHEFNINSSRQLGDVLFNELRLPPTRRTKSGYSTDAAALDGLKEMLDAGEAEGVDPKAYEVLNRVLEFRQLSKIKSTYVDALPALVNAKTGRIHTNYNQTGSATGRVSSSDPNVQNIPVRTELGRQVRKAFVAEDAPQWTLLGADYSQIELRILAHISQDEGLLTAFHNGEDIHNATAASIYDAPINAVTDEMRRIAKIMNFGVLYGLSPFGIRRQTGFSADEGKRFIDTYFSKYPGIREYIDSVKRGVKERRYVETLSGRRRYINEVQSRNYNVRASGERMAVNMPIQGTAADIIKIAMIGIQRQLDALAMRSRMIIQVHDELIFEAPLDELDRLKAIVMEIMPSALPLDVPLDVELKSGANWGDMG